MNSTELTSRQRTVIFANLVVSCISSSLLATALNTALPAINASLGISAQTGQWLVSAYSLAMAVMMPLTAFLITRFPTKRLYVAALAAFCAGLVVCALAQGFAVMMVGRILQACANGVLNNLTQVVILSMYPPEEKGRAMGWYGLAVGAAPVVAPTIGGILVDTVGWRSIFWLSLVVCAAALVMALCVFRNLLEVSVHAFDVPSFALSALFFGGLTLGVGNVAALGLTHPATFVPLVVGAATGVLFTWRQLASSEPFLKMTLLGLRAFRLGTLGSMLLYFVMMGSSIIMPLYVQDVVGASALTSALVMLPGSLLMTVINPLAGRVYDRLGMRVLAIAGGVALLVSNAGMCLVQVETPLALAAALNAVRCVAIGCMMMPLVTWGNSPVAQADLAHGTALLTSFRTIAGALGTAVFVGVMEAVGALAQPVVGMQVAFAAMAAFSALLLFLGVFRIRG